MKMQALNAEYVDHHGSDLLVVNAARASFDKESTWADPMNKVLKQADAKLIRFLALGYRTSEWDALLNEIIDHARHGSRADLTELLIAFKRKPQHWAPFGHPHCTIRVTMPIFLARQFVKHQVGGVWSEESRRYVSDEPGVWFPDEWHTRPEDIKQGSGAVIQHNMVATDVAHCTTVNALCSYDELLKMGVAPEEARIVLPLNMMTTVVWTGSLLFWSRVCNQRVDSHAQRAAQELGRGIADIMRPLYPVSWRELCE